MVRYLFGLIILTSVLTAQYTINDIELVKTTFTQKYDKKIILPYLQSDDAEKVKAALLSIAQSRDTSFIPVIQNLSFEKYGDYISFALGQLGQSESSTKYLLSRLNIQNTPFRKELYEAIGKSGTYGTLEKLLNEYKEGSPSEGISLAIANFAFRNIIDSSGKVFTVLSKEFLNEDHNINRRIDALFTTSRLDVPKTMLADLNKLLKEYFQGEEGIHFLQYALAANRKTGTAPSDVSIIKQLLQHKDWRIKTEAVKVFCLSSYEAKEDIDEYLILLKDNNPNVSRQTAVSVRSIKSTDTNRKYLHDKLRNYLSQSDALIINTLGELFISFITLFPDDLHSTIAELENRLDRNFIYNALEQSTVNPEKNVDYIMAHKPQNYTEMISYFSAAAANLNPAKGKLDQLILDSLDSSFAPAVTIIAESLDSSFILKYKPQLKEIVLKRIKENLNDTDFAEALISLSNLARKIDTSVYNEALNQLKNSSIYSLHKFSMTELKLPLPAKSLENFNNSWSNAFKYKSAKVITGKGEFTIKFNPEYAPVSVGNFCYLAKTGYFKNNKFHRVVPNFVIQTGDPQGTGWGGPGYEIISEFSPLDYSTGVVGMASAGKDTEGSQWFVTHSYFPHLNGRYTIFGKVIEGLHAVNIIDQGDELIKIILNE